DLFIYLTGESDVGLLLGDELNKPSFEWAETFCTLFDNSVRIYTNGEFTLDDKPKLIYYRTPRKVVFKGCVDPSTGRAAAADVICEFKDDIAELIVDEAVAILAGDMENLIQLQRNNQSAAQNT